MAQRTLACSVCHGQQGRAAPDGYYPRIAGKPAGYLLNQLRNFRDGRRHYGLMTALLDPLSDVYLQEISTYFAGLDLPYPAPQASQTSGLQGARAVACGAHRGGQAGRSAADHHDVDLAVHRRVARGLGDEVHRITRP